MKSEDIKELLEEKFLAFNKPGFIELDPISVPHHFSKKEDVEISGLIASVLAWGQRKTIINKSMELFSLMDMAPHDFILYHSDEDLKSFTKFVHRTFNPTDTLYFIHFLRWFYEKHQSLEEAFWGGMSGDDVNTEKGLIYFHRLFFTLPDAPSRTKKHIATPERKSACKRINMYLRWMVRQDDQGVDFGIWQNIKPSQLVCPCDLHVDRVARRLGLISRKQTDWQTAIELTDHLREFDPGDPVKYDFALFGLGLEEKYQTSF
jgi:uncharacterized protein (TIGR02757 family)